MDLKILLENTIPKSKDNSTKIINNIKLLNHHLTETIKTINDLKKNIDLNVNTLESISTQEASYQEIINSHMPELHRIRKSHHDRMSSAFNDQGTLCKLIFTDGTCFSSGAVNIFGGSVFIHETYPNLACIYTSDIKSTFEAEFAAMTMALKEAVELALPDILIVSDSQIAVSYANALLEAKSVQRLDSARTHLVITPSHKLSNSFLALSSKLNSIQCNFIHSHTNNRSTFHDGNRKADDLCKQAISLFKESLNHDNDDNPTAQITQIPLTNIKILMRINCGIKNYIPYYELPQQNDVTTYQDPDEHDDQLPYPNMGEPSPTELELLD